MKRARDPGVVRAALAARGLSQREVARLADCSKSTVGFVVTDQRAVNDGLAQRLARVLRCPIDELFVDAVSNPKRSDDQQEAVA